MRIVVGGLGQKSGKTTLVCRIVAVSTELQWTAVKVSHEAAPEGVAYSLEEDASGGDTKRFREAGAARTYWLRGDLTAALPALQTLLDASPNWIVESGRAARLLAHDYALLAVDAARIDDDKVRALLGGRETDG